MDAGNKTCTVYRKCQNNHKTDYNFYHPVVTSINKISDEIFLPEKLSIDLSSKQLPWFLLRQMDCCPQPTSDRPRCGSIPGGCSRGKWVWTRFNQNKNNNSMAKTLGLCKLCLDLGFDSACNGKPLHG